MDRFLTYLTATQNTKTILNILTLQLQITTWIWMISMRKDDQHFSSLLSKTIKTGLPCLLRMGVMWMQDAMQMGGRFYMKQVFKGKLNGLGF